MITQAIKGWLHKMFAWWPWRQSPPVEDQHVTSAVSRSSAQETSSRIAQEGIVPQTGATPRRFLLESRAERLTQLRSEVSDMPPLSPLAPLSKPAEAAVEGPTPEQRLDFLRYLVQRGIVNEGFENDSSDPL